jgi:hypothetical protein
VLSVAPVETKEDREEWAVYSTIERTRPMDGEPEQAIAADYPRNQLAGFVIRHRRQRRALRGVGNGRCRP